MPFDYLKRGVIAGVVAGMVYGLYVALVANPLASYIHDYGHAHDHGHNGHDHAQHAHEPAHAVSETTNAIVSVGSGILWGIFLAGVFAIAYYFLEPALPGRSGLRATILGAAGFFSVSLMPWTVLPPAAPGADVTMGIDARLALYIGLVGLGLVVSAIAIITYWRFATGGRFRAVALSAVPVLVTGGLLVALAPTIITHPDLPGDLVMAFQGTVLLSQAALWALIVAGFVWLQGRSDGLAQTNRPEATEDLLSTP